MGKVIRPSCWHQNFVPWGLSVPAPGLYTLLNHEENCIKSGFKDIFLKLVTNEWSDKTFLLTLKFCPLGVVCPCPGAIYMYKIMKKNCIKSDFKEIILKLVASDGSDKRFLLTSKFCPLGLSAPDLQLYTFIKSWKDVYKVRNWKDFLNLQQMIIVIRPSCWYQNFGPNGLSAPTLGLCLNFFSSITADFNISSALRWAIQDQWSSGLFYFIEIEGRTV